LISILLTKTEFLRHGIALLCWKCH